MTTQIEFNAVEKYYGRYHALKNVNLTIEKGEFVALVGPSGCGKSTLLRTLAGLEKISGGEVKIAGEKMNDMPPRRRDIAMVFQSYALYPHMTVEENLTYSLRTHGMKKKDAQVKAREVAETTGLSNLLERYPRELSGGQRQRVAMSRAIIRDPKAFLFDEPLSNLDAALRVHMRKEIRTLHDRLGATSVYVTHDQIEAMTMADRVVLMKEGRIEQQGAPLELYDSPANQFVAGFIGSPAMNFLPAVVGEDGHSLKLELGDGDVLPYAGKLEAGRKVTVGLRPEHLELVSAEEAQFSLPLRIAEATGATTFLFTASDPEIAVVINDRAAVTPGEPLNMRIAPELIHIFDRETGIRL
ncbi:sn-glycerol-3-phosphate ABC transporter ATP-binding protein UgpC [Martelella lutilitoris]|uniref:sn-glycerol-3-phosphate ABC transporter ATP-binding protein UgpC n=1 Tax=Martelella lutilitoris TaxID=2583532 RepID=A0A5C4JUL8_9HYPH|nr:sn-glycerol-3-phosphate ABC transporter ATP-binding protein UgpC [Martelella lutilitoris]TNB48952.1 sn-glycerol-3-phosphate ABC transporter ATP-binding protein UgpC [Martelella lutilitoris]